MNKVSVVSTILNEAGKIEELLDELINQTRRPDEIIIVDGGSDDGTVKLVQDYSEKYKFVKLINEPGVNIARGRNIGIKNSVNHIVAVIDGGCRPEKNWLELLVKPLENDPSVDAVKGVYKSEPYSIFEYFCGLLHWAGGLIEIDEEKYPLSGRCSAFRKEIWGKAGGYPEWLYTAEDTLFHERLKRINAKIKLAREAIVYWRPRKNLRKLAKMYFLYGRGEGRIGGNRYGAFYHLRNYLILFVLVLSSLFYHALIPFFLGFLSYIYIQFYWPNIRRLKKVYSGWKIILYVPIILAVRTISHSLGLLVGNYEYRKKTGFKENLENYLRVNVHTKTNERI